MHFSNSIVRAMFAASMLAAPLAAHAQAWPAKPVKLIVPFSAGGGADNAARVIAQHLGAALGQQVLIDNRAGGTGTIGAQAVATAPADGYTVLYDASSYSINPALKKLPFDPKKDLIPVSLAVSAPYIFVVHPESPHKTFAAFIDFARKNPGKLSIASYGSGSAPHLAGEMLRNAAGIDTLHVPYKGGAPALTDVMGGQVSAYFSNAAAGLNYVKAGKLRALAVTSEKRMPALPDVPTVIESGFRDFDVLEWNGFFVPRGTPQPVIDRLATEIQASLRNPDVRKQLQQIGVDPIGSTPAEFAAYVQKQMTRWAAVVEKNKITAD